MQSSHIPWDAVKTVIRLYFLLPKPVLDKEEIKNSLWIKNILTKKKKEGKNQNHLGIEEGKTKWSNEQSYHL